MLETTQKNFAEKTVVKGVQDNSEEKAVPELKYLTNNMFAMVSASRWTLPISL